MINKNIKEFDNYVKLIDNVLKISMFCQDINFVNSVANEYYQYFINVSNLINSYGATITDGIMCAIINDGSNKDAKINFDNLKPNTLDQYQFIEFRKRVTNGYKSMHVECAAELEFFSSINKGNGIGKELIDCFHNQLIEKGIKEYYLFTNEICDYEWYINHNYKLVNSIKIDVSDLKAIMCRDDFKLFLFKKNIIQ